MNKKEEILKLYYEKHHKQKDIAEKLEVTQGYISQVVKADERYTRLTVGFDVPRTVNMNIKIPTQKYKRKCCISY